ncbi:nuclear pore complex subunit [Neophaeococcomyces mojaviensis]|uniref:Nuclear pore complex subunit n=1 Tax=Neophaeococcomyces mojaviensis TaxID=3383035 RepID=A0ACC3A422_9EURO|nr:nuclear pore complex subunit [Knufia sp. JES_112]
MSLFGPSSGSGSSSLLGSLNLDTSVPSDPSAKRKSIFEPLSTTSARGQSDMFSGFGGGSQATPPSGTPSLPTFSLNPPPGAGTSGTSATPAPAAGGLFGATTSGTAPASSGLFGSTPSTAAGTSTGLFSPPAKPTLNTFNPIGAPAPTKQQPPSFGLGSTLAQPANTSTFGASSSVQPQNVNPQFESAPAFARESAYFNGLLERQKKKAKFSNADQNGQLGQLPSMNMDLGDLARRAQELGQKNQKLGQSVSRDSRAHYLLSGSGVTPGQAYKDFQKFDADTPQPFASTARVDFAEEGSAYLKGMQTKGREAMLRESMDRVYQDVDRFIEESLGIDFDEQKKRIMQHFGLMAKDDTANEPGVSTSSFARSQSPAKNKSGRRSVFGRSGLDKSMIGNASSIAGSSSFFGGTVTNVPSGLSKHQSIRDLRGKERAFVDKVETFNKTRLEEKPYNILQEFKVVEKEYPRDVPKQLFDAYEALEDITRENSAARGLKERQFVKAHAEDDSNPEEAIKLKKQILNGSQSYLEKSFYAEVEALIKGNPRTAQVGGMPSIINKIRAYIRVRAERHDLAPEGSELQQIGDSGDYCWIIIFYLLRSGFVKEAVDYVNGDAAFQSTDRRFVSYLTSYANNPDRRLSRKLQEMIDGEYQQRAKNAPKGTVDPYRMACYKVIGRCDLAQRNLETVGQGVEDWLWLQFTLAREAESAEDAAGDVFGLDQICETVHEIGEKHFPKGQADAANSYGTFFVMQILAGMFEQAVDYLHSYNPLSAVHFAIALTYYGLLRASDYQTAGNELLSYSTKQQPQINFVPLIAYYTTLFRAALPVQAVDYLALICLNSDLTPSSIGNVHTSACHECLRELCLETREFAALLGDIRSDGSRIRGAIEQRAKLIRLDSQEQFLRFITSQAASVADSRGQIADASRSRQRINQGQIADAVLLYHLCDDYDNVTAVLNRALADAVAIELGDAPMSLQPLKPRRAIDGSETASQASTSTQPYSSLSLTQSTSSPVELATNMANLYSTNASYFSRITSSNRETLRTLLVMLSARAKIEHPTAPEYLRALEELNDMNILPLGARGDISKIRQMATTFSSLPQIVTRCAGLVILWCVRAIGGERERIAREGSWGDAEAKEQMETLKGQLGQMARDLMVFAGLVKYKLPARVYDLLTRAGGEVGDY